MNINTQVERIGRLIADKRWTEARNLSFDLVQAQPRNAIFWRMRADLHLRLLEYTEAIPCILRFLDLGHQSNRDVIQALHALSTAYFQTRQMRDAILALDKLLVLAPDHADAHTMRAMCHLMLADFARGWPEYNWRLKTAALNVPPMPGRWWKGEPLHGRRILINGEQGQGDMIQFVRYVQMIKALGATTILACLPSLGRLFTEIGSVNELVMEGDISPPYDYWTALMSLPGIFHPHIPAVPYLTAPVSPATALVQRRNRLCVGLVWAGNPNNPNDRLRSLLPSQLLTLIHGSQVDFYSLQKQAEFVSPQMVDLSGALRDFSDTAAVIQALDLVISVDTSVAHLAGALGKPVWTLLPFVPDWRWMLDREDSPWYPTMRLFRQPAPGDWASVIRRVREELQRWN